MIDTGILSDLPTAEPTSEVINVCVTNVVSLTEFCVQPMSVEDELCQMAVELSEVCDNSTLETELQLTSMDVGSLCCARYQGTFSNCSIEHVATS